MFVNFGSLCKFNVQPLVYFNQFQNVAMAEVILSNLLFLSLTGKKWLPWPSLHRITFLGYFLHKCAYSSKFILLNSEPSFNPKVEVKYKKLWKFYNKTLKYFWKLIITLPRNVCRVLNFSFSTWMKPNLFRSNYIPCPELFWEFYNGLFRKFQFIWHSTTFYAF